MIKRPSRKLINSSLRADDVPLCVNTYDYAYSDPTDPSVPLPSSVGVTLNAPVKVTFPTLGVSGFTASGNSFGVTSSAPALPFRVSNPDRYQVLASQSGAGNVISVSRASDSASAVFEVPTYPGDPITKLYGTGFYNRSDYKYLFSTYAVLKHSSASSEDSIRTLVLVYSPLKFLPQSFGMVGYGFYTDSASETAFFSRISTERQFNVTSVTSPTLVDTSNGTVELGAWYGGSNTGIDSGSAFVMGTTTFAFNL